jgi:hypothetical protein
MARAKEGIVETETLHRDIIFQPSAANKNGAEEQS